MIGVVLRGQRSGAVASGRGLRRITLCNVKRVSGSDSSVGGKHCGAMTNLYDGWRTEIMRGLRNASGWRPRHA